MYVSKGNCTCLSHVIIHSSHIPLGAGTDFLTPAASDLIVTFPEGSVNGASDCFQIEILDDGDFEGDHEFGLSIMSVSPAGIAAPFAGIAQVTIMDNDGKLLTQIAPTHVRLLAPTCTPLSLSVSLSPCIICPTSTRSLQMLRSPYLCLPMVVVRVLLSQCA